MASKEELTKEEYDCPICWDKMETGRKLPCGHLFHNFCLRSWLEQDTSCPTCRKSLRNHQIESPRDMNANAAPDLNFAFRTSRLHFDGPRYSRWLPSVQIEVARHVNPLNRFQPTNNLENVPGGFAGEPNGVAAVPAASTDNASSSAERSASRPRVDSSSSTDSSNSSDSLSSGGSSSSGSPDSENASNLIYFTESQSS